MSPREKKALVRVVPEEKKVRLQEKKVLARVVLLVMKAVLPLVPEEKKVLVLLEMKAVLPLVPEEKKVLARVAPLEMKAVLPQVLVMPDPVEMRGLVALVRVVLLERRILK